MNEEASQPTGPSTPPQLENLLGKRIVAGIIDLVLVIAIGAVLTALFGDTSSGDDGFNASLSGGPFLLYVVLVFGYYFVMEAFLGQTLGKMALGIKVVATSGSSASMGSIAIRTVLRIVDGFAFYLIAVLAIALSSKHQRIGDMAASTMVVSAPKP
jgi:uncharacterized RDD family membrane protein YckC